MPASSPSSRFEGKAAIVTGAAQGIGRSVAERLAAEGARVIVADLDQTHGQRVVDGIREAGGDATRYTADLQTAQGARGLVELAVEKFGRVDVAVHNVGGTIWAKPFWEYTESEIEQEIARSFWPTMWGCHAVVPQMLKQGSGAIVNIGSVAVRSHFRVPYGSAKAGVHAMTVCLAQELGDSGVRVNCVAPGGIDSGPRAIPRNPNPLSEREQAWKKEMTARTIAGTPLGRYGRPEEVCAAVCFLASDEASYITGEVLYVSGGGRL